MIYYKTTIIVWSKHDTSNRSLSDIAESVRNREYTMTTKRSEMVSDPSIDEDAPSPEFLLRNQRRKHVR